jgi:hypothetical protein
MHHNNRWPTEPPATGYTRSTTGRRRLRLEPVTLVPAAVVLLIAAIAVYVVLQDSPARGAADHAAVVAPPSSVPGPPVRRADELPGDGTWLVGRTVKPGVYQSAGGKLCYWERLAGLSGDYVDLTANGGFRDGPLLVEILASDYAFSSQGCYKWTRVSDR